MVALARPLLAALLASIAIVSVWTPLVHPAIAARGFTWPQLLWFAPVPLLVLGAAWALLRSLTRQPHATPFVLTLALVFLGYSGLFISLWPHIIPPAIDNWQAAAPPQSMGFALVGTLFIPPFVLMYTAWSYWVFRGKVRPGAGCH